MIAFRLKSLLLSQFLKFEILPQVFPVLWAICVVVFCRQNSEQGLLRMAREGRTGVGDCLSCPPRRHIVWPWATQFTSSSSTCSVKSYTYQFIMSSVFNFLNLINHPWITSKKVTLLHKQQNVIKWLSPLFSWLNFTSQIVVKNDKILATHCFMKLTWSHSIQKLRECRIVKGKEDNFSLAQLAPNCR